jgi:hypothetical protein
LFQLVGRALEAGRQFAAPFERKQFAEGTAHTTTKWDMHYAGLARRRQGVAGG